MLPSIFRGMRKFSGIQLLIAGLSLGFVLVLFKSVDFDGGLRIKKNATLSETNDIGYLRHADGDTNIVEGATTNSTGNTRPKYDVRVDGLNASTRDNTGSKPPAMTVSAEQIYKERASYAMSQCYHQDRGRVTVTMKHDKTKLAYCKVPKVGCTFWLRMLLYLHNDTGGFDVKTPFEIPRHFVHLGKKKYLKNYKDFSSIEKQVANYTRFMFTRNPYARLWSAYLDKYRLPDFWRFNYVQIIGKRSNISKKASRCKHDVTFVEFLQYVTGLSAKQMNEHWQPVSYRCDPCIFKPNVIGKVETFNDDAKYILGKIGHEEILSSFNREEYVEEELAMLTEYNFDLLDVSFYKPCLTAESVALLLWEVFQLNGYLPKHVAATDIIKDIKNIDKTSFKDFVINFYRSASKEDKDQWKLQKTSALKEAFLAVPQDLKDKISSIYKRDFSLFGYDNTPPG